MFFNSDGEQIDEQQGHFAKNGDPETRTISIPCYSDYQISCTTVANFAVRCKHSSEGSFTDIEATPKSVDTWAGSTEDFVFEFEPGSVNGTYQPTIVYGPA